MVNRRRRRQDIRVFAAEQGISYTAAMRALDARDAGVSSTRLSVRFEASGKSFSWDMANDAHVRLVGDAPLRDDAVDVLRSAVEGEGGSFVSVARVDSEERCREVSLSMVREMGERYSELSRSGQFRVGGVSERVVFSFSASRVLTLSEGDKQEVQECVTQVVRKGRAAGVHVVLHGAILSDLVRAFGAVTALDGGVLALGDELSTEGVEVPGWGSFVLDEAWNVPVSGGSDSAELQRRERSSSSDGLRVSEDDVLPVFAADGVGRVWMPVSGDAAGNWSAKDADGWGDWVLRPYGEQEDAHGPFTRYEAWPTVVTVGWADWEHVPGVGDGDVYVYSDVNSVRLGPVRRTLASLLADDPGVDLSHTEPLPQDPDVGERREGSWRDAVNASARPQP